MYEMYGDPSPRNRPCVGACYYEKLRGLKSKTEAEQIPNETVQVNNMVKKLCILLMVGFCQKFQCGSKKRAKSLSWAENWQKSPFNLMHESKRWYLFSLLWSEIQKNCKRNSKPSHFFVRKTLLLKKSEKQVSTANDPALKIAFEALVEKVKINLKLPRKFIFG